MSNRVKEQVKRELNTCSGWDDGIGEAESQLEDVEMRSTSLRALIADWKEKRGSGIVWPGSKVENAPTQK